MRSRCARPPLDKCSWGTPENEHPERPSPAAPDTGRRQDEEAPGGDPAGPEPQALRFLCVCRPVEKVLLRCQAGCAQPRVPLAQDPCHGNEPQGCRADVEAL